eukprot:GHRR01037451.1.p1 GENE.GHRR01037451.1~~GHRR01037451.1.p1  ORF type:complete len:104 (-),score=15.65 GHRR01037451.1:242-553(-)
MMSTLIFQQLPETDALIASSHAAQPILIVIKLLLPLPAAATANNIQLVLANDPDADRLAAAEQILGESGRGTGRFKTFSGNDIGLLLADWVWTNFKQRHPQVR